MTGYFALAYGISWGGILILLVARGLDLTALLPLDTSLMFVLMLLGLATRLMDGPVKQGRFS